MLNDVWNVRETLIKNITKTILEIIVSQTLENKIQGLKIVTVLLFLLLLFLF